MIYKWIRAVGAFILVLGILSSISFWDTSIYTSLIIIGSSIASSVIFLGFAELIESVKNIESKICGPNVTNIAPRKEIFKDVSSN